MKLKAGHKLLNGATVLVSDELRPVGNSGALSTVVLAQNPETDEYATWVYIEPHKQGRQPYCVHGWYSSDIEEAFLDFVQRTKGLARFLRVATERSYNS